MSGSTDKNSWWWAVWFLVRLALVVAGSCLVANWAGRLRRDVDEVKAKQQPPAMGPFEVQR